MLYNIISLWFWTRWFFFQSFWCYNRNIKNEVISTAADAVTPFGARASAAMVSKMQNKLTPVTG